MLMVISFKEQRLTERAILHTTQLLLMFARHHLISLVSKLENQLVRKVINQPNGITHGPLKMLLLLENGATSRLISQNLSQEVLS
jgi:hypothetical protein